MYTQLTMPTEIVRASTTHTTQIGGFFITILGFAHVVLELQAQNLLSEYFVTSDAVDLSIVARKWSSPRGERALQCGAVEEFHRVKISCLKAHRELVDGGDVFVSQCCSGAGVADKTFARVSASLSTSVLMSFMATLYWSDVGRAICNAIALRRKLV